jgi:hypothetical protein
MRVRAMLVSRLAIFSLSASPSRAGERVMASVSRFLTKTLRLKVNEAKSAPSGR